MRMTSIAIAAFAAAAAANLLAAPEARATIEYPWCAVYTGGSFGGRNCGFTTVEQCRLTVSGIGGFCEEDSFYNSPSQRPARRKTG